MLPAGRALLRMEQQELCRMAGISIAVELARERLLALDSVVVSRALCRMAGISIATPLRMEGAEGAISGSYENVSAVIRAVCTKTRFERTGDEVRRERDVTALKPWTWPPR
jgi:hypothetical protein